MTPPESPASLLERAAAKLEVITGRAYEGPWEVISRPHTDQVRCAYGSRNDGDLVAADASRNNSRWIATMSPAVAAPLCEMLRGSVDHPSTAAVVLARAILGTPVPGEDE